MSEMTAFQSEQFGQVQTIVINGVPWFVGVDVCKDPEAKDVGVEQVLVIHGGIESLRLQKKLLDKRRRRDE